MNNTFDQEVLDQLLQVEDMIVKAARMMREIQAKIQFQEKLPVRRRDLGDAKNIAEVLFRMVEPYHTEEPEQLTTEELRDGEYNEWAPRGDLSVFRHRYELLTGARVGKYIESNRPYPYDHSGYWKYPKTKRNEDG